MPTLSELECLASLSTLTSSSCHIFQNILSKPISIITLPEQPSISEIRCCGESGCVFCKLVWDGVSSMLPNVSTWGDKKAFGFILRDVHMEWLRVGIVQEGIEDTLSDVPREWVDFHWVATQSTGNGTKDSPDDKGASTTLNYSQLRSWMALCQSSHRTCGFLQQQKRVPTRLIEIDMGDNTFDIVLRENVPAEESYIALSYCWGCSLPLQTLRSNLQSHKSRITWSSLPVLFRDVVTIARLLRVRYVWIDALCIIQKDTADWSREGANMAAYYGNALLTIAADASFDANCTGFPQPVSQPIVLCVATPSTSIRVSKVPTHVSMKSIRLDQNPPSTMPLFSRAWAFQERLMSPRILHLGPEELVWECSAELWCECGAPPDVWKGTPEPPIKPFRVSHYNALTNGEDLGSYWHGLIEMYLIRKLTFGTDRLKALMGLAKQIKGSQRLGDYVLGLWSSTFYSSLLWCNLTQGCSRNDRFPTWSWASIDGTWAYQQPPRAYQFISTATITKRPLELWDIDQTKTNSPYELVISGQAVNAALAPRKCESLAQWTLCTGFSSDKDMDLLINIDMKPHGHLHGQSLAVICLQLGISDTGSKKRSWGLVLRAREDNNTTFERLGIMTSSENWYSWGASKREMRIY